MPETPESAERIAKIQKDVEALKEDMEDYWHSNRDIYEKRVENVLDGDSNRITLYLEIDGQRSIKEIEESLVASGRGIAHVSLWRALQRLKKGGLVSQVGVKSRSPVFAKKRWALILGMDEYVKTKIASQETGAHI